jgi:hypothetical protein
MRAGSKATGPRRRVIGWLTWFAALNLLWLIFISAWVPEEEILGLFASAVAATGAEAVREQGVAGFQPQLSWFWRAVRESALVVAALARHLSGRGPVRGTFRIVSVALPDDPREQAAKRALLTAGESFAPNSYVLTIDNRRGLMLKHELVAEERE